MSYYDDEGAGTIAPFLAVNQIQPQDGRVLLADFDTELPSLHSLFSLPQSPGISDLCQPTNGAAVSPLPFHGADGLDVLPAGNRVDGTHHLNLLQFPGVIEQWKRSYQYIVLKMPPLSRSSLVLELAEYIDDVILVVESERVRREVLVQSITRLSRSGITIFGVILNRSRYYVPKWLYNKRL